MQGFSISLCENSRFIRAAALLPGDIYDLTEEGRETLIARRIAEVAPVRWYGQSPRAIRSYPHPAFQPFTLILLPNTENVADYRAWAEASPLAPTLVAKDGDISFGDLTIEGLQRQFLMVCDRIPSIVSAESVERARAALQSWAPKAPRDLGYQVGGHNSVTPNLIALAGAGFANMIYGPFEKIMQGTGPYVAQIVQTANSILDERDRFSRRAMHRIYPPMPDLTLFAPAIYQHIFEARLSSTLGRDTRKAFETARRTLQRQTGYMFEARTAAQQAVIAGRRFAESRGQKEPAPHPLMLMRAQELRLSTEVMSAVAASEFSAVLRLPNEINRTLGTVRNFASHYRSDRPTSRKRLIAFRQVQQRLASAVPGEFLDVIRRSKSGIRIVSDAHLEWLDLDGLPLAVRKCCTRIPVTPGNLFVDQLAAKPLLRLSPIDFGKVLVISALKRDDPIQGMFDIAVAGFEPQWRDKLSVEFAEVSTRDEFMAALTNFDGPLIVFDGHGNHRRDEPGQLYLKDEAVDVWSLKEEITRIAPIVVLSACDTHAADRNHATVANGFMHLGARTVLVSVFPLNGPQAAIFTARLLYRVAAYLASGIAILDHPIRWSEVIWGMLRMQLLTDFLRQLERKRFIDHSAYNEIHLQGNISINSGQPDPFGTVTTLLQGLGLPRAELLREMEMAVANSSVISYLQIGRPETILIDSPDRIARHLAEIENPAAEPACPAQELVRPAFDR